MAESDISAGKHGDGYEKKRFNILDLYGFAVGCIGVRPDDFCSMTPEEFTAVADRWGEHQMSIYRSGWEQARFLALQMAAPYVKRKLSPTDIIRFAWDDKPSKAEAATKEYFEHVRKRYGNE